MQIERPSSALKHIDRRQIIFLVLFVIACLLLLPHLIRFDHFLSLLRQANPMLILLAAVMEILRYFVSSGSTLALARLYDRHVPLVPMTEAFFAGSALNRAFSTGGAPGMFIRLWFLVKHGVHTGAVAAIFLIEDVIGLAIGVAVFFFGLTTLSSTQSIEALTAQALAFLVGSAILGLLAIYVLRQRASIYRIIHGTARLCNRLTERFLRRTIYAPSSVDETLGDFYAGLHAARLKPHLWLLSLFFNILRYMAGGAALYFCFHALGNVISPGGLILLYTAVTVLSTTSAIPGEVAILGTGALFFFGSLGIDPEAAVLALVLSRTIAFWLPIPVGLLALVHLRRAHDL